MHLRVSLAAALLALSLGAAGIARAEADADVERLLGSDRETERFMELLPFKRALGVSGTVSGSLAASTEAAGVPPGAMLEALTSLGTTVDLQREVKDGDRFYVRYEQEFSIDNVPVGVGRVLWAELVLASRRVVAVHRFKPRNGSEALYTANGQATSAQRIRLPVDTIVVSSGFGLRVDPMDQPLRGTVLGMGPGRTPALPPGLTSAGPALKEVNAATPLGLAMGLSPNALSGFQLKSRGGMVMHEGVDLVAPPGTPIHAAADGIVKGAEPKGRYGNWVEIEHEGKMSTVYGHLSRFAAGITPGTRVAQGVIIGYVGTTGRTTGPHVHFELLMNGRPVNPISFAMARRAHLVGPDMADLRKAIARDRAERDRENLRQ